MFWTTSSIVVSCPSCGGPCALQARNEGGVAQALRLAPHAVPDADFAPQAVLCSMGETEVQMQVATRVEAPDLRGRLTWLDEAVRLIGASSAIVFGLQADALRQLGGRPQASIHRDADGPYVREAVHLQVGKVSASGARRRAATDAERAAMEAAQPEPPSCLLLSELVSP